MPQAQRTPEGTERYYQTRERAKARLLSTFGRVVNEEDLVKLLTSFALDERKRAEQDKGLDEVSQAFAAQETTHRPVQPPTKAEQEATADLAFGTPQDTDYACFVKARNKGEPTFTLRAQDVSAPSLIREWVRRNGATCPVKKLADALRIAQAMDRWPVAQKKAAD